ncbi:hypothetical protein [Natronorubrum sulfidifaciens]|uniref:Uncharacterized protein n=1 Tax=Natronorubrum sulfidifaciens JCM 14089 TaxID=1230460 RepID=L9WJJ1_9EURY|nr:hypothetical protein [Natronorubrum sulfidifaciens]ELY49396.1 hypothetical protein C495_00485 [Natronorubrum sulfidifaciens JCM 14089]
MIDQSMIRGQWHDDSTASNGRNRREIGPAVVHGRLENDADSAPGAERDAVGVDANRSNEVIV